MDTITPTIFMGPLRQSDPSRERRMRALRAPAALAPATAQPISFPAHRRDPAPIVFPSSGGRTRSPLIVPARALDVAVQRSQHSDPRVHQEVAALGGTDQASDCGLPFGQVLLGLRQLHDVAGCIPAG